MTQMQIDFREEEVPRTPLTMFLGWAHQNDRYRVECDSVAEKVFSDRGDAFDRCKCLLDGITPEQAEVMGIYDYSLPWRVLTFRSWAIRVGMPMDTVTRVWDCDYLRRQFKDEDGNVIAEYGRQQ